MTKTPQERASKAQAASFETQKGSATATPPSDLPSAACIDAVVAEIPRNCPRPGAPTEPAHPLMAAACFQGTATPVHRRRSTSVVQSGLRARLMGRRRERDTTQHLTPMRVMSRRNKSALASISPSDDSLCAGLWGQCFTSHLGNRKAAID
jgi:hypothetical protein